MKKNILSALLLLAVGFSSCSDDIFEQQAIPQGDTYNTFLAHAPNYIPAKTTRMDFDMNTGEFQGFSYGDTLGLYYQEGPHSVTIPFTFSSSVSASSAFFTNRGFLLNPASTYFVSAPYIQDATLDEVPFKNNKLSAVMTAKLETDDNGQAEANFEMLTARLVLNMPLPPGDYTRIRIEADNEAVKFYDTFNLNLKSNKMSKITYSDTLSFQRSFGAGQKKITPFSIYLFPQDLSNTNLTIKVFSQYDNMIVELKAKGEDFKAGYSYDIQPEFVSGDISPTFLSNGLKMMNRLFISPEPYSWGMGGNSLTNWIWGDILAGDANKGSIAADQPQLEDLKNWSFDGNNYFIINYWNVSDQVMRQINSFISITNYGDKLKYEHGYGLFARAYFGFEKLKIFGAAIPYPTERDYDETMQPVLPNIDESGNYIYIWDKLIQDLQQAIPLLPETPQPGKVTSWAAKALLAKIYLYRSSPYNGKNGAGTNQWAQAAALLNEIINSGHFALHNSYPEIFTLNGDNTSESVFDVELTKATKDWLDCTPIVPNIGAPKFYGSWGFYLPTYEFANSFIVDENGLPSDDYMTQEPLSKLSLYNPDRIETSLSVPTDPRLDVAVGRVGVPFYGTVIPNDLGISFRDPRYSGLYMIKKYSPEPSEIGVIGSSVSATDKNLHLIRYAEVLLMAAECAIEQGDLTTARTYINNVRTRAAQDYVKISGGDFVMNFNGNSYPNAAANYHIGLYDEFPSKEAATKALRREYRLELGLEGHRWFDLARWGIIADELNAHKGYDENIVRDGDRKIIRNTYQPDWVTMPIPSQLVSMYSGILRQNENWE